MMIMHIIVAIILIIPSFCYCMSPHINEIIKVLESTIIKKEELSEACKQNIAGYFKQLPSPRQLLEIRYAQAKNIIMLKEFLRSAKKFGAHNSEQKVHKKEEGLLCLITSCFGSISLGLWALAKTGL